VLGWVFGADRIISADLLGLGAISEFYLTRSFSEGSMNATDFYFLS
jgi:hypothetical protein